MSSTRVAFLFAVLWTGVQYVMAQSLDVPLEVRFAILQNRVTGEEQDISEIRQDLEKEKANLTSMLQTVEGLRRLLQNQNTTRRLQNETDHLRNDVDNLKQENANLRTNLSKTSQQVSNLQMKLQEQDRQKVFFYAYLSDNNFAPLFAPDYVRISFRDVLFNEGDGYDIEHGVFEAPYSGVYLFMLTLYSSRATTKPTKVQMQYRRMDDEQDPYNLHDSAITIFNFDVQGTQHMMVYLSRGDIAWVEVISGLYFGGWLGSNHHDADNFGIGKGSTFSGFLLKAMVMT